jgi:ketosteroid isomerase-like protein
MTLPVGIEKLHQADVAATLARDVDALTALWDDDGVLLQPGRSPVIGKTAFAEFLKQNLAESASLKVLKYAPEIRDIQVEGDIAYEWGIFNSTVRYPISSNQRTSAHDS